MCMEELELTEAQAKALLDSPTPLADVYREFEKLETGYMDVIRQTPARAVPMKCVGNRSRNQSVRRRPRIKDYGPDVEVPEA